MSNVADLPADSIYSLCPIKQLGVEFLRLVWDAPPALVYKRLVWTFDIEGHLSIVGKGASYTEALSSPIHTLGSTADYIEPTVFAC